MAHTPEGISVASSQDLIRSPGGKKLPNPAEEFIPSNILLIPSIKLDPSANMDPFILNGGALGLSSMPNNCTSELNTPEITIDRWEYSTKPRSSCLGNGSFTPKSKPNDRMVDIGPTSPALYNDTFNKSTKPELNNYCTIDENSSLKDKKLYSETNAVVENFVNNSETFDETYINANNSETFDETDINLNNPETFDETDINLHNSETFHGTCIIMGSPSRSFDQQQAATSGWYPLNLNNGTLSSIPLGILSSINNVMTQDSSTEEDNSDELMDCFDERFEMINKILSTPDFENLLSEAISNPALLQEPIQDQPSEEEMIDSFLIRDKENALTNSNESYTNNPSTSDLESIQTPSVKQEELSVNDNENSSTNSNEPNPNNPSTSNEPYLNNPSTFNEPYPNHPSTSKVLESFQTTYGKQKQLRVIDNVKIIIPKKVKTNQISFEPEANMRIDITLNKNYLSTIQEIDIQPQLQSSQPSISYKGKRAIRHTIQEIQPQKERPQPSTSYKAKRTIKQSVKLEDFTSGSSDDEEEKVLNSVRKRKRFSLTDLSDAEKYRRIREQNNVASKKCRMRKKEELQIYEEQLKSLPKEKKILAQKLEAENKRLLQWKELLNLQFHHQYLFV